MSQVSDVAGSLGFRFSERKTGEVACGIEDQVGESEVLVGSTSTDVGGVPCVDCLSPPRGLEGRRLGSGRVTGRNH